MLVAWKIAPATDALDRGEWYIKDMKTLRGERDGKERDVKGDRSQRKEAYLHYFLGTFLEALVEACDQYLRVAGGAHTFIVKRQNTILFSVFKNITTLMKNLFVDCEPSFESCDYIMTAMGGRS